MRLGIKFPDVVLAIREAVKESGQSLGILKLANESEDAVEDLAEHLVFLESRVKAGIAIIEEQLAADSGGGGSPSRTAQVAVPSDEDVDRVRAVLDLEGSRATRDTIQDKLQNKHGYGMSNSKLSTILDSLRQLGEYKAPARKRGDSQ